MANLNVAVLGSPGYAKGIGKKSTASDITFYDVKVGDTTVSLVEPSSYPEKLASLFYSVSLADMAIVVVDEIGAGFGETVVMLECAGVKNGFIIPRNYITPDQIASSVKGSSLASFGIRQDDPLKLRQELVELAASRGSAEPQVNGDVGSVAVDHFFDVRGVGTVVLGCVADGLVRRHDSVRVLPSGKEAEVRSIQKHDDDYESAVKGDRVGLALKGVSVEDLDRGTVITSDKGMEFTTTLEGAAKLVGYWPRSLSDGMVLHVGHWMQFQPGRIESRIDGASWRETRLKISMDKPIVLGAHARAILTYLDGQKLRVAGTITV